MVYRALAYKTYLLLGLQSPLLNYQKSILKQNYEIHVSKRLDIEYMHYATDCMHNVSNGAAVLRSIKLVFF